MQLIQDDSGKEACTKLRYEVTSADLPLSCPTKDMRVWDAHPRVFLPIEVTREVVCPYCGSEFILKNE